MHFSRNLKIAAIALAIITVGVIASLAFVFVPPSLQISLAGVGGCSATQEQWRQNADEHFEEVTFWDLRMAQMYRFREQILPRLEVSDWLFDSGTPLHLLLTMSDSSPDVCDSELLSLFEHYLISGVDINAYDDYGITAIHQAVISRKVKFVQLLVDYSADISLPVKIEGSPILGMDVMQIIEEFRPHSNDQNLKKISAMIKDANLTKRSNSYRPSASTGHGQSRAA